MNDCRIVFIGGLTNGKIVLDYLLANRYVSIPLVITHPTGTDVPRYVDLPQGLGNTPVISDLDTDKHVDRIKKIAPDFIFVAGWSGLLSQKLIEIPSGGTIGFHPSILPYDRGRSVLAWQIEEGYVQTALTMFYYNELPDCGDIIAQERIVIEHNDYIADVLDKVDAAAYNIIRAYFPLLRRGIAPRKPQDINEGGFRRLRTDRDSLINFDTNFNVIYNKIRAISRPYPGAFFIHDGRRIKVWKSEPVSSDLFPEAKSIAPGTIVEQSADNFIVKCRNGFIRLFTDDDESKECHA